MSTEHIGKIYYTPLNTRGRTMHYVTEDGHYTSTVPLNTNSPTMLESMIESVVKRVANEL